MSTELYEILKKEKPQIKTFSSGLQAALWPVQGFQKKYGFLSCPFGSVHNQLRLGETDLYIPEGAAHFLEHQIFTEEDGQNVFDRFAALGASCNAYTSYTSTNYIFSTWEYTEQCLELLLDFVQSLYITQESLEKEKKVIQQEIAMYYDHPGWRAVFNLLQGMYHMHPVSRDIAGTPESVDSLDQDILRKCHNLFYHPSQLLLVIIGDINSDTMEAIIGENQEAKNFSEPQTFSFLPSEEPQNIQKRESCEFLSISQPLFHLGFKVPFHFQEGNKQLRREIIFALLLDIILGSASPAFYQLYDDSLIDDGFSFGFNGDTDFGHVLIGGSTDDPEALQNRLLEIFNRVKEKGIEGSDLERAKRKLWGGFISGLNSLEILAGQFVKDTRKGLELTDHFRLLENICTMDLEEVLDYTMQDEYACSSIIKPYEHSKKEK